MPEVQSGLFVCLGRSVRQGLQEEAHGAEAVVAGEQGTVGVFHPVAVDVAVALCQLQHEGLQRLPRFGAEALRYSSLYGEERLPHL